MIVQLANGGLFDTDHGVKIKPLKHKTPKGFVLFDGLSVLDGQPIVVIATMESVNEKTGNMVQTWILRSDLSPVDAVKSGADISICGYCPHRHNLNGACYVMPFHAPLSVYKSYKKGQYSTDLPLFNSLVNSRALRLGSYGDPAAVPFHVWDNAIKNARSWTGYTHQVNHKNFDSDMLKITMVSTETPYQSKKLHDQGVKTFRIKTQSMPLLDNEIECLSDSAGIDCITCGICNAQQVSVAINIHGKKSSRFDKFERII